MTKLFNNTYLLCNRINSFDKLTTFSSISSKSLRGSSPYASSKAFLDAYTVSMGRELAKSPIIISGIQPGAFIAEENDWARNVHDRPEMVKDFLRHHHASGRLGSPDEIAPLILFMSSQYFSWGMGSIFNYDGGTM